MRRTIEKRGSNMKKFLVCFVCMAVCVTTGVCAMAASVVDQTLSLRGTAYHDDTSDIYVLTEEETYQSGAIWFSQVKCNDNFSLELDFYTGHANHYDSFGGADGICIAIYADSSKAGSDGEGLGFEGCGGYGVEIDTYQNIERNDPTYNHIAIIRDSVSNHLCIENADSFTEDGCWHHLQVTNRSSVCTVYVDGKQVLSEGGITPNGQYDIGITAATGAGCNFHAVRNIRLLEAEWTDATINPNEYCIHVVNENGQALKGASVSWEDSAGLFTKDTNESGNAYFPALTLGMPKISVSLPGYTLWTNRNSNWTKNVKRYSVVKLYPEAYGDYKLYSAYYSNSSTMSNSTDLLTKTKQLNLKNDGNLIGDLDFGNFYLSCSVADASSVERYVLYQNDKEIASCTSGSFGKLSVTSFSKGGGCFVRVIAKSGEKVDTAINLEFAENKAKKDTKISLTSGAISFTLSDDVPYVGGRTFNVKMPFETGVTMSATEDKVQLGFNVSATDDATIDQQLKKTRDLIRKTKRAGGFKLGKLSNKDQKIFESLIKDKNGWTLFKGLKDIDVNILGYAEMDFGSSVASGQLMIEIKIDPAVKFEYNAWVVVVPVTARVELGIGADIGSDFNYDFSTSTFDCKLSATPYAELTAFGGVGISKFIGVGAYGDAKIDWELVILPSPKTERLDLTGELGLKAYCAIWSYERPFAHNTWHLYTANSVNAASLQSVSIPWNSGLYDAGAYKVADLTYLSAESDWQGETASLMDACSSLS